MGQDSGFGIQDSGASTAPRAASSSFASPESRIPNPESSSLRLVIAGHVDHGKSTLIGRLLHDTQSLPEGKLEQIQAQCARRGMMFEWSFVMDALQAERDQGITIDTTQIPFRHAGRNYIIIDAPGHREFLKNMITGAAEADAALLLIDAKEGLREQTRRHATMLSLLGMRSLIVLINKMDAVNYDEAVFAQLQREIVAYLEGLQLAPRAVIPLSAREGDNLATKTQHMPWYRGPSVLEALAECCAAPAATHLPLRLPVQDVYKFDERRIIVGRIESGVLNVGDTLLFSPSGVSARVNSIEQWPDPSATQPPQTQARAGQSVGITLDTQIFVERGQVASLHGSGDSALPVAPHTVTRLPSRIFWLGAQPLALGARLTLKLGTASLTAELAAIRAVVDVDTLERRTANAVERLQVAEVEFKLRGLMALDVHAENPALGRFVLVDNYVIQGGGIVENVGLVDQGVVRAQAKSAHLTPLDLQITDAERAAMNGHKGGVVWLTGLSASGKSTLALALQKRLFAKGCQVFVLDGDNIRAGLNADLGFSAAERAENIRRVGEVAALFAKAGMIVLTAFISPYREDRKRARAAAPEHFHLVYVKADVKVCADRDPKGLYAKAQRGEIADFTGISAPYEAPEQPDLVIDTTTQSVEESVEALLDYIERELMVRA